MLLPMLPLKLHSTKQVNFNYQLIGNKSKEFIAVLLQVIASSTLGDAISKLGNKVDRGKGNKAVSVGGDGGCSKEGYCKQ
jgi:hypothetical protein